MENKINPLQKSQVKFNLDIHAIKEFSEKKKTLRKNRINFRGKDG